MIPYERQQKILELLQDRDFLKIEDLLELIPDVSESTLRRDIKELESTRQLERLTGGAIKAYSSVSELPSATKQTLHQDEKRLIAKLAAREVSEDDTIYIDSGSTCSALLAEVMNMDIHVVTTNTDAIKLAAGPTRAEIILVGGTYDPEISSLHGPLTLETIARFVFDKSFLGANGVDPKFGITTPHLQESSKKQLVIKRSKRSFLLADSSKFGLVASVTFAPLDAGTIITDRLPDEAYRRQARVIELNK